MIDDMGYDLKLPAVGELTFPQWQDWLVRYNAVLTERDAHIEKLEAEVERLVKSRNKWGKLYNKTLEKLRLSVMSDSEYVKIIDEKCVEQASRIEKLEAALQKCCENWDSPNFDNDWYALVELCRVFNERARIARKALEGKDE